MQYSKLTKPSLTSINFQGYCSFMVSIATRVSSGVGMSKVQTAGEDKALLSPALPPALPHRTSLAIEAFTRTSAPGSSQNIIPKAIRSSNLLIRCKDLGLWDCRERHGGFIQTGLTNSIFFVHGIDNTTLRNYNADEKDQH